ncbi:Reverse transcriptase (RNA-dependent DNA polymerase) [Popillia japonica]|uniref:Reverse transcriptase (RNA-dependent DNA polymerase) n=1 Tax=Popillia japonica TaxID=7064 RepID=A0AAW1L4P8_POPJA
MSSLGSDLLGSITEANKPYPVCNIIENGAREWMEKIQVGSNLLVNFKLDTGSEANILPKQVYDKLTIKSKMRQNNKSLLVYNKQKLNVMGVSKITLKLIQRIYSTAETDTKKYETASSILNAFKDVFAGVGCFGKPYGTLAYMDDILVFGNSLEEHNCDLDGTLAYMDDILVFGNSLEEHNRRLAILLDKARKANVKFKLDKLQLAKNSVKFLGHTISNEGIHILDERIEAIQKMKRPANISNRR